MVVDHSRRVDLDLAQVRAFVATADELHFGRAAEHLFLSQQALSKRIARLEENLGHQLFDRGRHGVGLTEAGRRFLEPARQALAAGDFAVASARREDRPLRIDVWGHLYGPVRTVQQIVDAMPDTEVELGVSRDLPAAVTALRRGEIDVGFGRVNPLPEPWDDVLTHRLVRLEPLDAIMSADHALADAPQLRPADLRESRLWYPAAIERLDFLRRFAERFDIAGESGVNLGAGPLLDHLRAAPRFFTLLPADAPRVDDQGIRAIPLVDPTPLYAWSFIWRSQERHSGLETLLKAHSGLVRERRWLDYDPTRDWLPDTDLPTGPTR
jgi:DNA-binding transcriptional LysR family regulator